MGVIGLTGGVGSGKSLAAEILRDITGGELLIADHLGHVAMEKGNPGYARILETFGEGMLSPDGQIDRKKLAELVFQDEEGLNQLNRIVHPLVKGYLEERIAAKREEEGVIILESAILFETGCDRLCDEVWYVWVPEQVRIQRLRESRGYSREKSRAIMAQQMGEEAYRSRCQKIIRNDGSVEELETALESALTKYSKSIHNLLK